jgi:hypothetical protein
MGDVLFFPKHPRPGRRRAVVGRFGAEILLFTGIRIEYWDAERSRSPVRPPSSPRRPRSPSRVS